MTRSINRRNHKEKLSFKDKPPTREKFLVASREETVQQQIVPKFTPATKNQVLAVNYLKEGRNVVVLRGSAGSGKSMLAAWWAATKMKDKSIDKVFLIRPAVPTGNTIGLLKGSEEEKLAPFFVQTLAHLETFMGAGFLHYCLEKKKIEMKAVEYLRGYSFENCIVIAEESQNFTAPDMEMALTRLGKNCQIIFTGDEKQHDLKGTSGLQKTVELIQRTIQDEPDYLLDKDLDELESGVGVVTFMPEDSMRGGLTKAFVKMYYNHKDTSR